MIISARITIHDRKVRTDVGRTIRHGAGTVVGEAREFVAADLPEVGFDNGPANNIIGAEPGPVSVRVARHTLNVRVGFTGIGLGTINGIVKEHPLEPFAAREGRPLIVDAGDSEVARELNLCNTRNSSVEVLGSPVSIHVSEQGRWLD